MTKLLLRLWLVCVVALLPASAKAALTPADLEGLLVAHVTVGNSAQHATGLTPNCGIVRINNSGAMYIENFLGSYNIPCDLVISEGQQYFRIKMDPTARLKAYATEGLMANRAVFRPISLDDLGMSYADGYWLGNFNEPLYGFDLCPTSTQYLYGYIEDRGDYYTVNLDGCDPYAADYGLGFKASFYNNYNQVIEEEIYGGLILNIFKGNAIAVDYKDGKEVDRYEVKLSKYTQSGSDRLEIYNFMNGGVCLEVSKGTLSSKRWETLLGNPDALIDYANQTISIDEIGANFEIGYIYYGEHTFSEGWTDFTDYWIGRDNSRGTQYYYCGDTNPNSSVATHAPITGRFETIDKLSHVNYDQNAWVTNDGTVRTKTGGWILELDGTAYHNGNTILDRVDRTEIIPLDTEDVTADFILDIENYSAYDLGDKGEFRINANIVPRNNCHNVEKYELYVVPKAMSSINEFEAGKHSYTDGHADAVMIGSQPATAANGASAIAFDAPYTLTGDKFHSDLNDYSLFVKTSYKSETGLEPTFHHLTPLTDVVITAIGITGADSHATVEAGNGTITVSGAETVAIYSTTGVEVYSGPSATVNVAPGIYVVNAAGKVTKVIVK